MRLTTIKVPRGCTEICVDVEDGKLIVSYGSSINSKEFYCEETDNTEEMPSVGDFAIFWSSRKRKCAVVANVEDLKLSNKDKWFASDGFVYEKAIKFRNYEQYLKVKGQYAENEP